MSSVQPIIRSRDVMVGCAVELWLNHPVIEPAAPAAAAVLSEFATQIGSIGDSASRRNLLLEATGARDVYDELEGTWLGEDERLLVALREAESGVTWRMRRLVRERTPEPEVERSAHEVRRASEQLQRTFERAAYGGLPATLSAHKTVVDQFKWLQPGGVVAGLMPETNGLLKLATDSAFDGITGTTLGRGLTSGSIGSATAMQRMAVDGLQSVLRTQQKGLGEVLGQMSRGFVGEDLRRASAGLAGVDLRGVRGLAAFVEQGAFRSVLNNAAGVGLGRSSVDVLSGALGRSVLDSCAWANFGRLVHDGLGLAALRGLWSDPFADLRERSAALVEWIAGLQHPFAAVLDALGFEAWKLRGLTAERLVDVLLWALEQVLRETDLVDSLIDAVARAPMHEDHQQRLVGALRSARDGDWVIAIALLHMGVEGAAVDLGRGDPRVADRRGKGPVNDGLFKIVMGGSVWLELVVFCLYREDGHLVRHGRSTGTSRRRTLLGVWAVAAFIEDRLGEPAVDYTVDLVAGRLNDAIAATEPAALK